MSAEPLSQAEWREREHVFAAIHRLRMRFPAGLAEMPDLVEIARKALLRGRVHRSWAFPQPFHLPQFRGEQSKAEWEKESDERYRKFRDDQWRKCRVGMGDEPLVEPGERRGPGKRGRNAGIDERYEWAALRWLGLSWKSIAGLYRPCRSAQELMAAASAIEKAANKILRGAKLVTSDRPDSNGSD